MSNPDKKLRIAHIAPLFASVPPEKYGGTERVIDWLIREQVKMGHEVTIFASGDSTTPAKVIPIVPRALWHEENIVYHDAYHTMELDVMAKKSREFDIIHSHFNFIHYQSIHQIETPMVTTLHWRVDIQEFQDLYTYFDDVPLVAISNSQKSFIPQANVIDVVYHGLPLDEYTFGENGGDYIAFLGRFSPEKGIHIAIEVAKKVGMKLKIAARMPVGEADIDYYENIVKPMLKDDSVEYVGELGESEKISFLKKANVTIIPTSWPEPFGLVTIESLACGTPVVAYPVGCTKELVKDGEVGFCARTVDEMVEAVKKVSQIDRRKCRKYIEENFSSSVMAKNYEKVYKKIIAS